MKNKILLWNNSHEPTEIECLGSLEEKGEYFHLNACLPDSGEWNLEPLTKGPY